jgi:hypothetical protein
MDNLYRQLGLDFSLKDDTHIYFQLFDIHLFNQYYPDDPVTIDKGAKRYYYANLYEVILWHHYYSIKHRHITKKYKADFHKRLLCKNRSYFSRIPANYLNLDRAQGLVLIRKAVDIILKRHRGIPTYYDSDVLTHYLAIK